MAGLSNQLALGIFYFCRLSAWIAGCITSVPTVTVPLVQVPTQPVSRSHVIASLLQPWPFWSEQSPQTQNIC